MRHERVQARLAQRGRLAVPTGALPITGTTGQRAIESDQTSEHLWTILYDNSNDIFKTVVRKWMKLAQDHDE